MGHSKQHRCLLLFHYSLNCSLIGHTRRTCAKFNCNSQRIGSNTFEDSVMDESLSLDRDNEPHPAHTPTPFTPKRPKIDKTIGSTRRPVRRQLFSSNKDFSLVHSGWAAHEVVNSNGLRNSVNAVVMQNSCFTVDEANQVIVTIAKCTH